MKEHYVRVPCYLSHLVPRIFSLKHHWTHRLAKENAPFWTLGAASYKDVTIEKPNEAFVLMQNAMMHCYFDDMYDFLLKFFAYQFQAPFRYKANAPLPGFHIFGYCDEFLKPLARPHVDVPFNNYEWGKKLDINKIFTPVICLATPKAGSGMRIWDWGVNELASMSEADFDREFLKQPSEILDHEVDVCLIHEGKHMHQVEEFREREPGSFRITLQAHAVFDESIGVWELYW